MNIKIPSGESLMDKFVLGFCAFFGWAVAAWVSGKIPWPAV